MRKNTFVEHTDYSKQKSFKLVKGTGDIFI